MMAFIYPAYPQKQKKHKIIDDVYATKEDKSAIELPDSPKKTYKIVVKNNLSSDENFLLVGKTLVENDFAIDKKDKEFYTIKTVPKEVKKKRSDLYFMNFSIKDNSISITGQFTNNISFTMYGVTAESSYIKIVNKGMNDSSYKNSFNAMQSFALLLGSDLEYVTE